MPQEIIRNVRIENLSSPIVTAQILNSGAYGTDHSSLINLSVDDHPQYFNIERGDLRYLKLSEYSKDHSSLINLNADDHPQYFNIARGDLRYLKLSEYFQGHIIENEGIPLIQRTNLNFVGGGVTVTDNGSDTSIITIPDASIDKLCQINDVYCYTGTSSVSGSGSGQSSLPECIPADGSILIYDCDAENPGWYPSPQQQLPTVLFTDVDGEGTLRYVTPTPNIPNTIDAGVTNSSILSGKRNTINSGLLNTIISGSENRIFGGNQSVISGGSHNKIHESSGFIGGGQENRIRGTYGFIAGGYDNEIGSGSTGSSILGGWKSYVGGDYSVASGRNASTATYDGTFVFADSTTNVITIIPNANDQFAIKAAGGLRLIDGQQGANKVLTSDANGVGHWSDPTGSSTLNEVGAGSTTLSDSTYTLTNNVDVKFNSSEGNPIFKLDESAESILIGADTNPIINRDTKLYIEGDGNTTQTRTHFAVKNTGPASGAAFDMICNDGGAISIQASGTGYAGGHKAWVYSYEGLPLFLASDGDMSNGGLNDISFSPGGWNNTSVWFKPSGNVGIGTSLPSTALHIEKDMGPSGGEGIYLRNTNANGYSEVVFDNNITKSGGGFVFGYGGTGTGSSDHAYFWNRKPGPIRFGTDATERLRIDAGGNVGIGTSLPEAKLHVSNDDVTVNAGLISGTAPTSLVSGNGTTINSTIVAGSSSFNRPVFQGRRSRGTLTAPSAVINNDHIMSFVASGYDGSASQFGAAIDFFADANVTNGSVPTRISFSTGSNSSSRLERLTIKYDGDIGIGTTLPTARLHALAGSVAEMKFSSGAASITPALSVGNTNTSGKFATLIAGTNGSGLWFDESGFFSIASASKADYSSNGLGVTQDVRVRVDGATGNVGFGTDEPDAKVDVNGRMRFQSTTEPAPTSGKGFEAFYSSGSDKSFFLSVDRDPSIDTLKGIDMRGSDFEFWTGADLNNDAPRVKIVDDGLEVLDRIKLLNVMDGAPAFRSLYSGPANFRIQSSLRNGSQNTSFNIDAVGQPGDNNREVFVIGYFTSGGDKYKIASNNIGGGDLHPIHFEMGWDNPVMVIATDGNIGIGTETPDKALNITGSGPKSTLKITDDGNGSAAAEMYIGTNDGWSFFNDRSTKSFNIRETETGGTLVNTDRLTIIQGGNVGIGTTSPTADLEVNGVVKITGGNPGAGKVLTSDAGGTASWQTPTGGTGGTGGTETSATPTAETSFYIDAGAMQAPEGGASPSSSLDDGTNNSIDWWNVDTNEELFSKVAMPPQWDGGDIDVEFFWTVNGASTGDNIRWAASATGAGNGDAWDATFSTVTETADDLLIANDDVHIIKASGITPAGTTDDGNMLFIKLKRTPTVAQTASVDARLLGVRVHYKNVVHRSWYVNKMGAENEEADATVAEKTAFVAADGGIIYGVHSGVSTATSGAGLSVDVKINGVSILSTLGVIGAAQNSSDDTLSTSHILATNPTTFSKGDRISFELASFGGTGGNGLHTDLLISWAQ